MIIYKLNLLSIMKYYLKALKQYADFNGRARRKEYWMFTLFYAIFYLILNTTVLICIHTDNLTYINISSSILTLYLAAMFIPSLALCVRRLHDINKSGWNILLLLIPIVGAIIVFVYTVTAGDLGPNRFGKDPKDNTSEDMINYLY